LRDLLNFVRYYHHIIDRGREPAKELADAFYACTKLPYGSTYPFLLQLYNDYEKKILSKDNFVRALHLVESYIFRRIILKYPSNSHSRTFASLHGKIVPENYLESLQAAFLLMGWPRTFPRGEQFRKEFIACNFYDCLRHRRNYWLYRYENYQRKEPVYFDEHQLSVEHIMPQTLTEEYKQTLGENWEEIHGELLNTPGNLTITGYNSELGNHSFPKKRDMLNGFATSPFYLNRDLAKLEQWNDGEILARANRLFERFMMIWPEPYLPEDVLAKYG